MEKADAARPRQQCCFRGGGDVMRISRHVLVVLTSIMMVAPVYAIAVAQADEVMRAVHHGFGGVI
jgi:hypothetical protein